jgi:Putative zinc-finger
MSKHEIGHPGEGRLLRYIDGELPAGEARQVQRHLEACWQCRSEIDELQETVASCVRYRQSVLDRHLPPPPQPWADLYPEFARIDAAEARTGWLERLARPFARPMPWRWAAAGLAAAMVLGAVFLEFRKTPSVHAAELLQRAVAVARSQPKAGRHIRIRTKTQEITRVIGGAGVLAARTGREESAPAIQALFAAAHYDWDDPLSARSYQAWRDSVSRKSDNVVTIADPQKPSEECYQINTSADSGELADASLTLRATDLHPVESRLEFRNREWVELSEIPEPSMSGTNSNEHIEVPWRPEEPSLPAAAAPRESASISTELQVVATLHEIGADLGDPVEVARSGGRVLVSGVGIPPRRQKQIHDLLDSTPGVAVRFSEPVAVAALAETDPAGRVSAMPAGPASTGSIQARLEQQVGGRAEMERIGAQILDWSESAMARGYALRSLAQRFPAGAEGSMSASDRGMLAEMGRDHATAMLKQVGAIESALGPMLAALGGSAPAIRGGASGGPWQASAESAFRTARRVEVLLSVVLGVTPGDGATANLPSELLSALKQLEAELEDCQRLLSRNAGG